MEKGALTFPGGSTFPRWRGSNCIFLYKPIELVIFQGAGVLTPATSSGSARGIVNWARRHLVLAKRLSMTLTPDLCKFCAAVVNNDRVLLFSDWRYDWGIKNAMSRVVHRVSKAFGAMGYCIIPNVGCEGSLYI